MKGTEMHYYYSTKIQNYESCIFMSTLRISVQFARSHRDDCRRGGGRDSYSSYRDDRRRDDDRRGGGSSKYVLTNYWSLLY